MPGGGERRGKEKNMTDKNGLPNPDDIFPNEYKTSCYIKNVVKAPNILIGDYTYYDDPEDPAGFERNNVLFNYPEFGDRLIIGRFCAIAAGTDLYLDGEVRRPADLTAGVAGDGRGAAADAPGISKPAQHIRGPARRSDADHHVFRVQAVSFQIALAQGAVILGPLHRFQESLLASGDEAHHHAGRDPEGGGAFGGIQYAQPAAGARPHVEQPAALLKCLCRPVRRLGDLGQLFGDGQRHPCVLLVHGGDDLQFGHGVQLHGARVALFSRHSGQIQFHSSFARLSAVGFGVESLTPRIIAL